MASYSNPGLTPGIQGRMNPVNFYRQISAQGYQRMPGGFFNPQTGGKYVTGWYNNKSTTGTRTAQPYWQYQAPSANYGQQAQQPANYGALGAALGAGGGGVNYTDPQQREIYSTNDTQLAENMARAQAAQAGNLDWLQKQYMAPGMSLGAGSLSAAMPQAAEAFRLGEQAVGETQLAHGLANAQYNLSGQQQDFYNALGLANVEQSQDALNRSFLRSYRPMLFNAIMGY